MSYFNEEAPFYINERMNGVDESIPEFKYYYKNGQIQSYLYKGIFYTGTWPEYWAKFMYEYGEMNEAGPPHCRKCVMCGSKGGVMIGPCIDCACCYNDFELGPGFNNFRKEATIIIEGKPVPSVYELHMKYVDISTIGRPVELVLEESLELACNELKDKLFDKHGSSVDEIEAIESLIRFIKSFENPEEIRKKIDSALLIPDSKMYNQNWAGTDWEWFTGQLNRDESKSWTFTDEELTSVHEAQEIIRNLVASNNNKNVDTSSYEEDEK